jgi:hypothetical protein
MIWNNETQENNFNDPVFLLGTLLEAVSLG